MPIPKRESGERENDFIPRCMSEISGEYEQDQALAICYQQMSVSLIGDKEYRKMLTQKNPMMGNMKKEMKKK
jgi:hypothetical protein